MWRLVLRPHREAGQVACARQVARARRVARQVARALCLARAVQARVHPAVSEMRKAFLTTIAF